MYDKFQEAKEIYMQYGGNYFFMDRGDVALFQRYKSFNVPEELERQWDVEMYNSLTCKIPKENNFRQLVYMSASLLNLSRKLNTIQGLQFVYDFFIEHRNNFDVFTSLRLVESICGGMDDFSKIGRDKSLDIMKETINFLIKLESRYKIEKNIDEQLKQRIEDRKNEYILLYTKIVNEK